MAVDLSQAPTAFAARRGGEPTESGLMSVLDEVDELMHQQPARATELAEQTASTAARLGFGAVSARASYGLARLYAERGELDRSLNLIDTARTEWLRVGDLVSAARTDLGRMQILDDLGRHAAAAQAGHRLLATLDRFSDDVLDQRSQQLLRAAALGNIGVASSFIGHHAEALAAYSESEAIYLALDEPTKVAQPRANRGIELLALGQAREAREVLTSARAAFLADGDRLWAAKCAGHLGDAHAQLGELVDGLRVLGEADEVLAELGAAPERARIQLGIARVYLAAGLHAEARAAADYAASSFSGAGLRHDEGFARLAGALARLGCGDLVGASAELAAALDIFVEVDDRQYLARTLLVTAEIAARLGDAGRAGQLLAAVIDLTGRGGWQVPLAWAALQQADLLTDLGQLGELLSEIDPLVAGLRLPYVRYAYDVRVARLRRAEGRGDEAELVLRGAVALTDRESSRLPDPTLRLAFRADRLAAHDELIDLLVERHRRGDVAEACRLSDHVKARTLLDLRVGTLGSPARCGDDDRLHQLHVDLSATHVAIAAERDPDAINRMRGHVVQLELEITMLRMTRAVRDQPAPAIASAAPPPAPFRTDATTISYHVIGDDVVAFVVQDGAVEVRRMNGVMGVVGTELDRLVGHWTHCRLSESRGSRAQAILRESTRRTLNSLYDLLMAPVRDLLGDPAELVVVPHRSLHSVPFPALHDGESYLIEQVAISLAPTLVGARGRQPDLGKGVLAFALPDERAVHIAAEADAIQRVLPGARVVRGAEATSALLFESVPGPGVLHLACHGQYRPGNPLFSGLHLADRWMTAADVLDLEMPGVLVVLSACESGRPGVETAEPVGLAWSFLAAGASDAIVSQWIVDDEVTSELMARMYTDLAGGAPPALALRAAQIDIARKAPHPYYWAPFIHVMCPESMDMRRFE